VLFTGLDSTGSFDLWVTDGTAAGTHELTGISGAFTGTGGLFGGSAVVSPADLTVFNGKVLFNGIDSAQLSGLWVTDGTAAGTHELTGINGADAGPSTGPPGLDPKDLTVFGNEVLFNGTDTGGTYGLWVTDGTAAGTHELTGIKGVAANGLDPADLTVFKNEVLFVGSDAAGDRGLWVTDGTAGGTHELTGIKGAYSGGIDPSNFAVMNNEVLFRGSDASGQEGLWVTNGTSAGTHELTGISGSASTGLGPNDLTAVTLQLSKALTGTQGADTFVFGSNFGENTITNFNVSNDTIELPKSEFADLAAVLADAHQVGANTVIAYDANDVITLNNVTVTELHAQNFHLV
jgi:ELWxxDGT repeat protein